MNFLEREEEGKGEKIETKSHDKRKEIERTRAS